VAASEAKNYPLLIDAIAALREQIDVRLFILGTGELEASMREQIRRRGLDDAIILCGFQKNPWKYIAKADVFVLSSHYEGFGNVLIEAMACGVPVVATSSAGTRDIVRHGVDGLLVESHDASSMSRALATLLSDRRILERMSAAAVQGAERFALPRIARLYDETLMGALA
jgi:glycosyltransferase involved in cell wall biosynthesis